MKKQNGITLIALIITIIVMMILVGVTVTVAMNGGLFGTADDSTKRTEKHAIHEQMIAAMKLTDNGNINVKGTYDEVVKMFGNDKVEPIDPEEVKDTTPEVTFTVTGKKGIYTYKITGTEIIVDPEEDGSGEEIVYNETYTTVVLADGTQKTYEIEGYVYMGKLESNPDYSATSVTEIYLGNTVTGISSPAMSNFTNLTKLYIPEGVTYIGAGAFGSLNSLTSVTIPSTCTNISVQVFPYCSNLQTVIIKNNPANLTNATNLDSWGNENTQIIYDY